tara:strand:- start:4306 stop:4689 length:384 start_codon:yes stop_codon:yes gene_type:complete
MKKLHKKIIILFVNLSLLYIFSNAVFAITEGNENQDALTIEEIEKINNRCAIAYDPEYEIKEMRKCRSDGKIEKLRKKEAAREANKIKDDLGISGPTFVCPEVTSLYNLFAKAYCIANNIRSGVQNI